MLALLTQCALALPPEASFVVLRRTEDSTPLLFRLCWAPLLLLGCSAFSASSTSSSADDATVGEAIGQHGLLKGKQS